MRALIGLVFMLTVSGAAPLVWAGASIPPKNLSYCAELLDPITRAREQERELDAKVPGRSEIRDFRILRLDKGQQIGDLFYLMNGPQIMSIENINVAEPMKNKGMSRLLISQAILLNPGTRQIRAQLAWDNAKAFYDARNSQPLRKKLFSPKEVNQLALEATPLFKVFSKLGFSKVARLEEINSSETIVVWLERETGN